ncbi:MAG: MlaC/ttg2D family ABC transporter substrate-binding protein [Opitutales bacterium]
MLLAKPSHIVLLACALVSAQFCIALTATEKLQKAISGVQKLTSEGRDFKQPEHRAALREQVESFFSPDHIARRALARGWSQLSAEQQATFVADFSELLILTYADQLNEGGDSEVKYLKELPLGETRREVHTEAVSDTGSLEILYRMTLHEDEWQVYDVIIEGVSLVSNYRSQFTSLLQRKGPDGLISSLGELVEKKKSR